MKHTSVGIEGEKSQQKFSPFFYLGFLPILLLLGLIIGFRLISHTVLIYEPTYLLPVFNTFLFLASCVIAYVAWRSYLLNGASTTLWLGCGVLSLGTGALAAGWLIYPFGPNVNVTIFNVSALMAAICHAGAVLTSLEEQLGEADCARRNKQALLFYLAAITAVVLLVVLTVTGTMPPFFIKGQGPTMLRQNVVEWAIVLYSFTALVLMIRFRRQRGSFFYWYSLALALVALAMLAFFLEPAVGSPIGWVGRSSYVVAAVYFLISVSSAWREANSRGLSLDEVLLQLFGKGLLWQEVLATVNDAVVSYDGRGRILQWNKAAERIFGYLDIEVIGKELNMILPCMQAINIQDLNNGIVEIELQRNDGTGFNAEVSLSSQKSSQGKIITLVIRDITERKRTEEDLAASRARFEAIFNSISDTVIFVDRERRIALLNPAVEAMFGYHMEELLGRSTEILYADPTDYEKQGRLRYHEGAVANQPLSEIKYRRKDGTVFDAESVGMPVHDGQGQFIGFVGIHRDISKRKQAEESLKKAHMDVMNEKNRLEAVMEALPVGVAILDEQGGNIRSNIMFEQVWGAPRPNPKEVREYAAFKAWWLDTGRRVQPEEWASALVVRHGKTVIGQLMEIERFDGEHRFIINSAVPILDADSNITGSAVAILDITERQQADQERQRLVKQLQQSEEELQASNEELMVQAEELQANQETLLWSNQRLDLLAETTSLLLASVVPQRVVDSLCPKVMKFLDCDVFFNFLLDEPEGKLRLNAYAGIPQEEAHRIEWLDYGVAVCGCAARDGCRIVAEDIFHTSDPRTELVKSYGIQVYACHPLLAQNRLLGTLSFGARNRARFTQEELGLMKAVADQVAIAMDRQQAEACINASLREKEVLLQEIHHRTKNNMNVICSLLSLQSLSIEDEKLQQIFHDTENRIRSMALVHEKLYQTKDLSNIDMGEYITDLASSVMANYQVKREEISLMLDVKSILVNIETAMPCGLIINELVSNAMKYAFPGEKKGMISITLQTSKEGKIDLRVADNGVGFPQDLDIRNTESLGMQLITNLAENQLQGELELYVEQGTEFRLRFQEQDYGKRI